MNHPENIKYEGNETVNKTYGKLQTYMDRVMTVRTAMALSGRDSETLASRETGELTSKVTGVLSGEYFQIVTYDEVKKLLEKCRGDKSLTTIEATNVRGLLERREQIRPISQSEYQEFACLTVRTTSVWARTRKDQDFEMFTPALEEVIRFQKKPAGCRAKSGRKLYDAMLGNYGRGFSTGSLGRFFSVPKRQLAPFLKKTVKERKMIEDSFLEGDYSKEKREELERSLTEYVGFDFNRGVMATSTHSFTTNLHDKDVHITAYYMNCADSSLFSAIYKTGHAICEPGIGGDLTLTPVGQGVSIGMHKSQPRFFESIIEHNHSFQAPIYDGIQAMFPEQLGKVNLDQFVETVNRVTPGLIRTEADELSYDLRMLIRCGAGKILIKEDSDTEKSPRFWADKYEECLGVRPESPVEGVPQDIHWSQGSFRYFPSYALGSAFGAQLYYHVKETMDPDSLLKDGRVGAIRDCLREHIHQYSKLKNNRQVPKGVTREDLNPKCCIRYLREEYFGLYGSESKG